MKEKSRYTYLLLTVLFAIRSLSGLGNEHRSLPDPSKNRLMVASFLVAGDTIPPQKTNQQKEKPKESANEPGGVSSETKANNPEKILEIKEVPKSRKQVKPVKIDVGPLPVKKIKPKIVIKKIKV